MARAGGMITILVISAIVNLVAVAASAPLFDLDDSVTVTGADGSTTTASGLTWDSLWPFALTVVAVIAGWQLFLRRDLQN